MGRLVVPQRRQNSSQGPQESSGGVRAPGGDNFMDRLVKYIPSEVLAAYLALDRAVGTDAMALKDKLKAQGLQETAVRWGAQQTLDYFLPHAVFAVLLVLTPICIWQYAASESGRAPWKLHACVATAAFAVWAYAIQGSVFVINELYYAKLAGLIVVVFTILSGFFRLSEVDEATPAPHAPEAILSWSTATLRPAASITQPAAQSAGRPL